MLDLPQYSSAMFQLGHIDQSYFPPDIDVV